MDSTGTDCALFRLSLHYVLFPFVPLSLVRSLVTLFCESPRFCIPTLCLKPYPSFPHILVGNYHHHHLTYRLFSLSFPLSPTLFVSCFLVFLDGATGAVFLISHLVFSSFFHSFILPSFPAGGSWSGRSIWSFSFTFFRSGFCIKVSEEGRKNRKNMEGRFSFTMGNWVDWLIE